MHLKDRAPIDRYRAIDRLQKKYLPIFRLRVFDRQTRVLRIHRLPTLIG